MAYQQLMKKNIVKGTSNRELGWMLLTKYLPKQDTNNCNKLILESHKKVLFIVRLTVSGGFSSWTSTPSALTINKSEILTHFSTEI